MKIAPNDYCWCGSGLKYKKCHLGRAEQPPIPLWEAAKQTRKILSRRVCSVPPSLQRDCRGKIVKAHTVSRSSCLSYIAWEGHVYGIRADLETLIKDNGRLEPQLIGIKDASTFTGFCAKHDSELFSPIENQPFRGTKEQVFLLAYRALCVEWYKKLAAAEHIQLLRQSDRGMPLRYQAAIQENLSAYAQGTHAAARTSIAHKSRFDEILLSADYSAIRFYRLEFNRPPTVMGCGGFFPEVDFAGAQLQNLLDTEKIMDAILFSSFASDDRGHFCFVWHQDLGQTCQRLIDSFAVIRDQDKPDATLRLMFEFCENLYLEPNWWEARTSQEKNIVVQRVQQGTVTVGRQQTCLVDDGQRMAAWQLMDVASG